MRYRNEGAIENIEKTAERWNSGPFSHWRFELPLELPVARQSRQTVVSSGLTVPPAWKRQTLAWASTSADSSRRRSRDVISAPITRSRQSPMSLASAIARASFAPLSHAATITQTELGKHGALKSARLQTDPPPVGAFLSKNTGAHANNGRTIRVAPALYVRAHFEEEGVTP